MAGEHFLIRGGKILSGSVEVPGAKNAALKMIAACLLTEERCVLENVPRITDVERMLAILRALGVTVEEEQEARRVAITAARVNPVGLPVEDIRMLRASIVLLGPLLVRCGSVRIPHPGGDHIGARPLTAHFRVLEQFGATIESDDSFINIRVPSRGLHAKKIVLPEFSVTATENALMIAAGLSGETTIDIAALEPHVQDLGAMLSAMGADVALAGPHRYRVRGSPKLHGTSWKVRGDPLVAFTFLSAGLLTRGEVGIRGANPEDLTLPLAKLQEMGVHVKVNGDTFAAGDPPAVLQATSVQAMPYPGVPSDLQPLFALLATQAEGASFIHDPLYENRFRYVEELLRMGADITHLDAHRIAVRGPTPLTGVPIASLDIRAGAVLVLAGLVAQGETMIDGVHHIDRGYEDLDGRLRELGADIQRVEE